MKVRQSACYLRASQINAELLRQLRHRSSDMFIMCAMKTIRYEYLCIQGSFMPAYPGRRNEHIISICSA